MADWQAKADETNTRCLGVKQRDKRQETVRKYVGAPQVRDATRYVVEDDTRRQLGMPRDVSQDIFRWMGASSRSRKFGSNILDG